MIAYETLLDAARQHFHSVAASPSYTRAARHAALSLERDATLELASLNNGRPKRRLVALDDFGLGGGPALRAVA